jgi:hypothetical protein
MKCTNFKQRYFHIAGSSSETTRDISSQDKNFLYWLAGLICGSGHFGVSRDLRVSCEITLRHTPYSTFAKIKERFNGLIEYRQKIKAYRWRLYKNKSMLVLATALNGKFLNPTRTMQFRKVCQILNITYIEPQFNLTKTAWFSGFMDAKGSFQINPRTLQFAIMIINRERVLLDLIQQSFGVGFVYPVSKIESNWRFYVNSLSHLEILLTYFKRYPPIAKGRRDIVTFQRLLLYKERKYHEENDQDPTLKHDFYHLLNLFLERKKI